jgi:hypothetical protein
MHSRYVETVIVQSAAGLRSRFGEGRFAASWSVMIIDLDWGVTQN